MHSLTSALDGGEWSASCPGRITYQGKSTWYALYRRLGGPQSLSIRSGEKKYSQPLPGLEPSIIKPVAQRYTTYTDGKPMCVCVCVSVCTLPLSYIYK
jgi:hypothetical protein